MRFRSIPLIALSIVLILAGALGSWHTPDDRDDDVVVSVHQHSDHDARFATPTHPIAPEHCAFCHWLRALGDGAPVAIQMVAAQPSHVISAGALVEHVRRSARLTLPSRAPPAGVYAYRPIGE